MSHTGSCHCGRVRFEIKGTPEAVVSCNCSICRRKGSLLWFVPRGNLTLLMPDADAATYTFNQHRIRHRFCPTCGMHPYGEGTDPKGNAMAAINVRCLEDFDFEPLPVKHFDGRSL